MDSGEKTSIKEWPTSLEIKGRVRLDAFEKFLQELPMSRTRAVMVYQGLLLFIVTNSCPLRCWLLAFCLQIRQCGLLALMANDFNLYLVLVVWMYESSSDESFSKIYQKSQFGCINVFIQGLLQNYFMIFCQEREREREHIKIFACDDPVNI